MHVVNSKRWGRIEEKLLNKKETKLEDMKNSQPIHIAKKNEDAFSERTTHSVANKNLIKRTQM